MEKCKACDGAGHRPAIFGYQPRCLSCKGTGMQQPDKAKEEEARRNSARLYNRVTAAPKGGITGMTPAELQAYFLLHGEPRWVPLLGAMVKTEEEAKAMYEAEAARVLYEHHHGMHMAATHQAAVNMVAQCEHMQKASEPAYAMGVPGEAKLGPASSYCDHIMQELKALCDDWEGDREGDVHVACSVCHGAGRIPDVKGAGSCCRCSGTGKVKVEKEIKMLKSEYEAGLNKLSQPWCMLSDTAKKVITKAGLYPGVLEYMKTNGEWVAKGELTTVFNDGMIYRVSPATPYAKPGLVEAKDIKGLTLSYTNDGTCILRFTNMEGMVGISVPSLMTMVQEHCMGGHIQQRVLQFWADCNQPKG